jgi:hypothetical protein
MNWFSYFDALRGCNESSAVMRCMCCRRAVMCQLSIINWRPTRPMPSTGHPSPPPAASNIPNNNTSRPRLHVISPQSERGVHHLANTDVSIASNNRFIPWMGLRRTLINADIHTRQSVINYEFGLLSTSRCSSKCLSSTHQSLATHLSVTALKFVDDIREPDCW